MTLLSDAPAHAVAPPVPAGTSLIDLTVPRPSDPVTAVPPTPVPPPVDVPLTVAVRGPLDLATLARVRAAVDDAVRTRPARLVVDLADCPYVDASGLAMLLEGHRRMARYGGVLTLRGACPRIVRLLSLTGLRHVFDLA